MKASDGIGVRRKQSLSTISLTVPCYLTKSFQTQDEGLLMAPTGCKYRNGTSFTFISQPQVCLQIPFLY